MHECGSPILLRFWVSFEDLRIPSVSPYLNVTVEVKEFSFPCHEFQGLQIDISIAHTAKCYMQYRSQSS
jgi:hypothetical protein